MNEHLNYLMQQLAERRRRDASLEAYRREMQTAPQDARREGYADMLRDMKNEPAPQPQTAPPYIAEPQITLQGKPNQDAPEVISNRVLPLSIDWKNF